MVPVDIMTRTHTLEKWCGYPYPCCGSGYLMVGVRVGVKIPTGYPCRSLLHIQKPLELLISRHLNWADDATELPISSAVPTKQPRDLSSLRSRNFSKNLFSSLQRRRPKCNKNRNHFINLKSQYHHHHAFSSPFYHFQKSHYHPQSPFSVTLNWDQDPHLADLGTAL